MYKISWGGRFGLLALSCLLWCLMHSPVLAHWADLAVAEINVDDLETRIALTIPTGLVASADSNKDGRVSAGEVRAHADELARALGPRIRLTDDRGRDGTLTVAPADPLGEPPELSGNTGPHSTLNLLYSWAEPARDLKIHYDLFLPGVSTARCLASIFRHGQVDSFVFTPTKEDFQLGGSTRWQTFWSFLALGVEHILTGYDHVLFLVSLLMLGGGMGYLLQVVTAFTLAHSITLSLAVLDVVALPSRLVERAIALTIVYVAAENFWRKSLRRRWLLTFTFGLIHGLGFASVLKEMNIPRPNLVVSLVSFNLGVEIGQVLIVSVAFLTLQALRRYKWEPSLRRWVSAGIIAVALFWFVQRAFFTA